MNGWERKREILRLAEENGYVKVDYLARRLHISESSIRRDLLSLEAEGEIRRTYGGAEPTKGGARLIPYDLRAHQNEAQKRTVAGLAASLVSDGDVVFLDGSSTAFYLVDHLSRLHGLTVVTNGLSTALALSGTQVRLISTGGRPNPENPTALVGSHAERLISEMHADVVFFSAQSLSEDGEITGYRIRTAQSKLSTVKALQSVGFDTIACGDSYNDLGMIRASKAGFLFRSTDKIIADNPDLRAFEAFDDLRDAIFEAL